jgi:hypothetical protein
VANWSEEKYVVGYAYASGRRDAGDTKHEPTAFANAFAKHTAADLDDLEAARRFWALWHIPPK